MNKRWYDKIEQNDEVLKKLQKLDKRNLEQVASELAKIAVSIKAIKREQDDVPISIGLERVKGLYMQNKNRRWYDKNDDLSAAMKAIATLSDDEYVGIIEALNLAIIE